MESASDEVFNDPCPIGPVVDLLFGRWTSHILHAIRHQGPIRFTDLQTQTPFITPKVLTERLRHLERNGFVRRLPQRGVRGVPRRVEYETTSLAETLVPIFGMLLEWSNLHLPEVRTAQIEFDRRSRLIS